MPRPEKVQAVTEISERFKRAEAALLTEYRGLRVPEIAEVRNALREAGADYKVLKNTLARIAVREVGLEDLVPQLEGPTAIAFIHGDAATAAKALDEAAKRFPVLVVKGGVLQGRVIDAAAARRLATLESREVLLSKIAMLMNSPVQQTANVLSALLRNFGSVLAQVLAKRESEELPSAERDTESPPQGAAAPEAEEQAAAAPESEAAAASTPEETPAEQSSENEE